MPVLSPPDNVVIPCFIPTNLLDKGWNVILHNDATVSAEHVVDTLCDVMGYSQTQSTNIMMEAHTNGKASVIVTSKLLAEHYQGLLRNEGLTVTIEEL